MNTLSRLCSNGFKPVRPGLSVVDPFQTRPSSIRSGIISQETPDELNREPRESREKQELDYAGNPRHAFARRNRDAFWGKSSPFAYFEYFAVPSAPFRKPLLLALLALSTLNLQISTASAQTTGFTFQGQLTSGAGNANGSFDMSFAVWDANVAGNFIAGPVTNSAVAVSNGLFTVPLNFGSGVFTGTNYWVQMGVRTNGGAGFATLVPRQQLTPTPYALYAAQATLATQAGTSAQAANATYATQSGTASNALALSGSAPQFNSLCPPGSIMAYMGTTAPPGWLLCNTPTPVSRTTFAALFSVIGTNSGAGDGSTTFNLPDLRGVFLRGVDIGNVTGRDPDGSSRRAFYPGGNTGANIATYQDDAFQGHHHEMEFANNAPGGGLSRPYYAGTGVKLFSAADAALGKAYQAASDGSHGAPKISSETRPLNFTVNYIIKF